MPNSSFYYPYIVMVISFSSITERNSSLGFVHHVFLWSLILLLLPCNVVGPSPGFANLIVRHVHATSDYLSRRKIEPIFLSLCVMLMLEWAFILCKEVHFYHLIAVSLVLMSQEYKI